MQCYFLTATLHISTVPYILINYFGCHCTKYKLIFWFLFSLCLFLFSLQISLLFPKCRPFLSSLFSLLSSLFFFFFISQSTKYKVIFCLLFPFPMSQQISLLFSSQIAAPFSLIFWLLFLFGFSLFFFLFSFCQPNKSLFSSELVWI